MVFPSTPDTRHSSLYSDLALREKQKNNLDLY